MTAVMIEADGLGRVFGEVTALHGVSFQVPRGSVLGLLGHNGAGKTTLVDILTTRLPPTAGTARVAGFNLADGARIRARIGLAGQTVAVHERLSGWDNLVVVARLLGAGRRAARRRADELIEVLGLTAAAHRLLRTYSGGMRRRLDLALAVVGGPDVVFLDEPTVGLDPQSRIALWRIVADLAHDGVTVLLTTQYLEEADRLADSVLVLADGRVVATGTPAELKAAVGHHAVHITLADGPEWIDLAARRLRATGLRPVVAPDPCTVSIPVPDPGAVAGIVRTLDAAGVTVADLRVSEPTMTDVYLALSRPAEEATC